MTECICEFLGTTNQVFDTQQVEISYFVNITNFPQVGISKLNALNRIDELCNCGGPSLWARASAFS